jgi:hypothetical protein
MYEIKRSYQCCIICAATVNTGHIVKPPVWDGHCSHNLYNSGFTSPTLGRHISTFRGYRILFSIRNPYINRFTNHFSIHSKPSYPQKVVLHSITARFCLRPYYSAIKIYNAVGRQRNLGLLPLLT